MRVVLIDTNIVSYLFLPHHGLFEKCREVIDDRQCYISFMTRGELMLWPSANRWGAERRLRLAQHVVQYPTLYPDEVVCRLWAETMAQRRRAGRPIDVADAWIAATAIRWDLPLITANYRDFDELSGLTLIPI